MKTNIVTDISEAMFSTVLQKIDALHPRLDVEATRGTSANGRNMRSLTGFSYLLFRKARQFFYCLFLEKTEDFTLGSVCKHANSLRSSSYQLCP